MKKLIMMVAVLSLGLVACNEATDGEATTTDSTAVVTTVTEADSTVVEVATTVTEADSTVVATTVTE